MHEIPLKPKSKAPRDLEWTTKDYPAQEIAAWRKQGHNVGLRLEATDLVLDIDPKNDPEGRDADEILTALDRELGTSLVSFPRNRTGSGGLHVLMTKDPGVKVRKYPFRGRRDLEFKAKGTQIVGPGSTHPKTGLKYAVEIEGTAQPVPSALLEKIRRRVTLHAGGQAEIPLSQVKRCLEMLDPTNFREQDRWLELGMAVHAATDGAPEAKEIWTTWSWSDSQYEGDETVGERWDSFSSGGEITKRTLFHYVVEVAGGVPPADAVDDFDEVDDAELDETPGYTPQWRFTGGNAPKVKANLLHNVLEAMRALAPDIGYNQHSYDFMWKQSGERFSDYHATKLTLDISNEWGPIWSGDPSAALVHAAADAYAHEHPYHPIRDYLDALKWDGEKRIQRWLVTYTDAEDTPYVQAVGRLLLIAAVGRVYRPGVKYDSVVVLEGPQGSGKSSLVRSLGGQFTKEGLPPFGSTPDKDIVGEIRHAWIVELDELIATKRSDVDRVKAFVSRTVDSARMSYARRTEDYPRQCVFIGTVNDAEYLRDMTGNRRWLPVDVGQCDFARVKEDRDQLWAEAVAAWKKEPRQELAIPVELRQEAAREQEARRMTHPAEDAIVEYLDQKPDLTRIQTQDLLVEALNVSPTSQRADWASKQLGEIMRRLGWVKTRFRKQGSSNPRSGYMKKEH